MRLDGGRGVGVLRIGGGPVADDFPILERLT